MADTRDDGPVGPELHDVAVQHQRPQRTVHTGRSVVPLAEDDLRPGPGPEPRRGPAGVRVPSPLERAEQRPPVGVEDERARHTGLVVPEHHLGGRVARVDDHDGSVRAGADGQLAPVEADPVGADPVGVVRVEGRHVRGGRRVPPDVLAREHPLPGNRRPMTSTELRTSSRRSAGSHRTKTVRPVRLPPTGILSVEVTRTSPLASTVRVAVKLLEMLSRSRGAERGCPAARR